MKKLNRKGFTLVELLAVIVILAIVVGISIPSVTSIINGSKDSALEVAVKSALDHLKDEVDIYNINQNAISGTETEAVILAGEKIYDINVTNTDTTIQAQLRAAATEAIKEFGFDTKNVSKLRLKVNLSAGTYCVEVQEVPKGSDYYTTSKWTLNAAGTLAIPNGASNSAGDGC